MSVLTKDSRYEQILNEERSPENICEVLDYVENKGRREGISLGRREGRREGRTEGQSEGRAMEFVQIVDSACANPELNWTPQQACRFLKKDYNQYLAYKKQYRL